MLNCIHLVDEIDSQLFSKIYCNFVTDMVSYNQKLTNEQFKEDFDMKTFTMNDLSLLVEIIGSSSKSDDRLPAFLAKFDFVDKYETDDDSVVYVTGNNKELEIEFFDIDSVYDRTISVLYRETPESRFTVLEWEDLNKIY